MPELEDDVTDLALLKETAWAVIREKEASIRELALRILEHPELGYQEEKASQWITEMLGAAGFEITQPYGALPTSFLAKKSSGDGPTIAFLAEYDALPGVGHGCGHNLIASAATAAAIGVAGVIEKLGGSVCVIGTPAEEYMGEEEGKVKLLRAGAFEGVSAAIMLHPNYYKQVMGRDMGFIAFELNFQGKPAHAAADPWNGLNALDGLLATFNNINALRQQMQPDVRIHGIISNGGQAPNIIPEFAQAQFMVRSRNPKTLEEAYERVQACAKAGALASGTEVEIRKITTVYNTRILSTMSELIEENYRQLGEPITADPYMMDASSDFGNVSQEIPAVMFFIDTHPEGIAWHSKEVAAGAGEESALQAMLKGAMVMAGAGIDLLGEPMLMDQVQEEFKSYDNE